MAAEAPQEPDYVWVPAATQDVKTMDGQLLPRFQSTAGDQPGADADRIAAIRSRLRHAYTPAQPVTDPSMFAGRVSVLTSVIRAIEDQRVHCVIYGERGIGKTSMLHMLARSAKDARYQVVYITCGARSEFDETIRAIASKISLIYHADFGPTSPEGERGDSFESTFDHEPLLVRSASDHFAKIEGTRVLVVMDEFDRITSEELRRAMAEFLKSLSDQAVRMQFVIAGVAANLTEIISNVPSIQRNIFAMQVPKMSPAELRDIVKNGERVSDIHFDEAAIEAVIRRSIGFPYLASLISHRAAIVGIDDHREIITADDVETATEDAVAEYRGRLSRRAQLQVEQLRKNGLMNALGVLAGAAQSAGGWFTLDDLKHTYGDAVAVDWARSAVDQLAVNRVLLEARDGDLERAYRFIEPSVPTYLWLLAGGGRADAPAKPARKAANA